MLTKYKGTYTFAKEDLMDEEGNPITSGTVVVLLNGSSQELILNIQMYQSGRRLHNDTYK